MQKRTHYIECYFIPNRELQLNKHKQASKACLLISNHLKQNKNQMALLHFVLQLTQKFIPQNETI